jgi:hypothetical protein
MNSGFYSLNGSHPSFESGGLFEERVRISSNASLCDAFCRVAPRARVNNAHSIRSLSHSLISPEWQMQKVDVPLGRALYDAQQAYFNGQEDDIPRSRSQPHMPRFKKWKRFETTTTDGKVHPGLSGMRLCVTDPSKHNGPVCPLCHAINDLKACGRCRRVYYCDAACQRAHWPRHKAECEPSPVTNTNTQ